MRRRADVLSAPFRAPRAPRPAGRYLDLTGCETVTKLRLLLAATRTHDASVPALEVKRV